MKEGRVHCLMRQYPFSDPSIVTMTCHYVWLCLPAFLSPTEEVTFPLSPLSLHPIPLFFLGGGVSLCMFPLEVWALSLPSSVWLFVHHVGEFHSSFIQMRGLFSLPHLPAAKTHSLSCCKFSCKLRQKCLQASFWVYSEILLLVRLRVTRGAQISPVLPWL